MPDPLEVGGDIDVERAAYNFFGGGSQTAWDAVATAINGGLTAEDVGGGSYADAAATTAALALKARLTEVNVVDHGAVADAVVINNAIGNSGSNIITSASARWVAGDVGKPIRLAAMGAAGATLNTTITQYDSASQVRIAVNVSTTQASGVGASWGTDSSAAFLAAFNALGALGGGTVVVPHGRFLVRSQMDLYFPLVAQARPSFVRLAGRGAGSQVIVQSTTVVTPFVFYGGLHHEVEDLVFVGTPNVATDAGAVFRFFSSYATLRNVLFLGLSTSLAVGMVSIHTGDLILDKGGCYGCGSSGAPTVSVDNWTGLTVQDWEFRDFGDHDNIHHSKGGQSNPVTAWIEALVPSASASTFGDRGIRLQNVRCDEGAVVAFKAAGGANRIKSIEISQFMANVMSQAGGTGVSVTKADKVKVRDSWFGYTTGAVRDAVLLSDVTTTELDHIQAVGSANRITADGTCGTLSVNDSTYTTLASSATRTHIRANGIGGVVPNVKAGIPSDADFDSAPPDGTLAVDTTNSKLYARIGGTWKSVTVA